MATSRYDSPAQTAAGSKTPTLAQGGSTTSGSQSGSSSTTGGSTSSGTRDSSSTTRSSSQSNTQNMTPGSLAALEQLIAQLSSGGTMTQRVQQAQRDQEIQANRNAREGYSRDNAFADAQGIMAQTMRQTLEKLLPGINRAASGAGASQGSMRALLTQQAASQAAEAASAQGLQAAVSYGGLQSQFGSILERLTQPNDAATASLLQALNVARGAVTNTSTSGTSQTQGSEQTSGQTTSNQQTNSNQNNNSTTAPIGGTTGGTNRSGQSDGLVYFGPQQSDLPAIQAGTGSSLQLLQQLGNQVGGWDDYTF